MPCLQFPINDKIVKVVQLLMAFRKLQMISSFSSTVFQFYSSTAYRITLPEKNSKLVKP